MVSYLVAERVSYGINRNDPWNHTCISRCFEDCMHTFGISKWYSIICIEIVTYMLGEDYSHTTTLIYDVEGAINKGYTETLPILVSRTKIFMLLFNVLPETLPPTLHKFLFPKDTV